MLFPTCSLTFYLALIAIQKLAKALEMDDLTLTQEFHHFIHVRIIRKSENIVIGSSGFLFSSQILHKISNRITLGLDIGSSKRYTGGICRINSIGMVYIIIAFAITIKALSAFAICELTYNTTDDLEMGKLFTADRL